MLLFTRKKMIELGVIVLNERSQTFNLPHVLIYLWRLKVLLTQKQREQRSFIGCEEKERGWAMPIKIEFEAGSSSKGPSVTQVPEDPMISSDL